MGEVYLLRLRDVQGGCAVRLFHKELEAYLVAEGLFEDDITEDGAFKIDYSVQAARMKL